MIKSALCRVRGSLWSEQALAKVQGICFSLQQSIISAASFQAVAELLQVWDPIKMDKRCCDNQHMEYLMRLKLRK